MRPLTPPEIRRLRTRLDWSARQMGSFLDRSHQTIYNWESDATRPGECVQAILHALKEELERRKNSQHGAAVSEWIDRLEEEGLSSFLEELVSGHSGRREIYAELVRESERNGCLLLETPDEKPQMYLLPLTPQGLQSFMDRVRDCDEAQRSGEHESSRLEEVRTATP